MDTREVFNSFCHYKTYALYWLKVLFLDRHYSMMITLSEVGEWRIKADVSIRSSPWWLVLLQCDMIFNKDLKKYTTILPTYSRTRWCSYAGWGLQYFRSFGSSRSIAALRCLIAALCPYQMYTVLQKWCSLILSWWEKLKEIFFVYIINFFYPNITIEAMACILQSKT